VPGNHEPIFINRLADLIQELSHGDEFNDRARTEQHDESVLCRLTWGCDRVEANPAPGKVYVHCKIGYSRSAAVVGAYLLSSGKAASVEEALAILRQGRPLLVVRGEAFDALRAFERASKPAGTVEGHVG
jgi:hypothetical protein